MTVRCRRPPAPARRAVRQPQVLGQPDQHGAHEERLVRVVADVFDLEHDVLPQQGPEVERVPADEEPAGGAAPEAGQPDPDEAEHVVGDPLGVADLRDDPFGCALQPGQGRVHRLARPAACGSPSARSQPASS